MPSQRRMEVLKRVEDREALPSLSPLTIKLIEMATDDSCSANDIAILVSQDPSLTTRILKLSNSALFRTRGQVSTLTQAVVVLGTNRLRSIALGMSLRDTFPMGVQGNMDYDRFWKISLYRALLGQEIAQATQSPYPEETFVAALILEIGQLMLHHVLSPQQRENYPNKSISNRESLDFERKAFGIDHREVGKIILTRWKFPPHLIEPQILEAGEVLAGKASKVAAMCELARIGAETFFIEGSNLSNLHKYAYQLFKIVPKDVNKLLVDTIEHVDEIAGALQFEIDRKKDIVEILEQANRALQRLNLEMAEQIREFLDKAEHEYGNQVVCSSEQIYQAREQAIESALQAVAHELRNPLLSLGGFVRRLSRAVGEDNVYVKMILAEATRIDRVLHELNDFARNYKPDFKLTSLTVLLDEVLTQFSYFISQNGIELTKRYDSDDVPEVYIDAAGIKQVFSHCTIIAISSMKSEPKQLFVTVQAHQSRGEISVGFEDTGENVDDAQLSTLADPILTSKTFGTGLGLPMSRKIIAWHGGRLEIKRGNLGGKRTDVFLPLLSFPGDKKPQS